MQRSASGDDLVSRAVGVGRASEREKGVWESRVERVTGV